MFKTILSGLHLSKNAVTGRNFIILSRSMSSEINDVIAESIKDKGVLTLNRPKVLNALDMSMVKKIIPILTQWEKEKTLVIVKGAGEKAFCAGGDVKSIALAGLKGEKLGQDFFRMEYTMDGIIGTYKIPYVAFVDGIVMGGGVGISVHGQYRVATERSMFAMPETQIGFFPDVGGSYFLPRLGGKLGLYLGLTGHRLKGSDILKAGIATHYVHSKDLDRLEQELIGCSSESDINETLQKFSVKDVPEFSLAPHLPNIDRCFSAPTIEGIISRLKEDNSEWAQNALKLLSRMSPTSLKVTKVLYEKGAHLSLLEALQLEYTAAVNVMGQKDFYEGVRALLIDKDQNPKWQPPRIEDVSQDIVDRHFTKLPEGQELRHKL